MIVQVPDEFKDAYNRFVTAGFKLIAAKGMGDDIGEGDPGQSLGEAIAGLVVAINSQGRGKVPSEILVPAAVELCVNAAEYLKKTGELDVDEDSLIKAIGVATGSLMKSAGIEPPEKPGGDGRMEEQMPEAEEPGQVTEEQEPPAEVQQEQQKGLLQGAMK